MKRHLTYLSILHQSCLEQDREGAHNELRNLCADMRAFDGLIFDLSETQQRHIIQSAISMLNNGWTKELGQLLKASSSVLDVTEPVDLIFEASKLNMWEAFQQSLQLANISLDQQRYTNSYLHRGLKGAVASNNIHAFETFKNIEKPFFEYEDIHQAIFHLCCFYNNDQVGLWLRQQMSTEDIYYFLRDKSHSYPQLEYKTLSSCIVEWQDQDSIAQMFHVSIKRDQSEWVKNLVTSLQYQDELSHIDKNNLICMFFTSLSLWKNNSKNIDIISFLAPFVCDMSDANVFRCAFTVITEEHVEDAVFNTLIKQPDVFAQWFLNQGRHETFDDDRYYKGLNNLVGKCGDMNMTVAQRLIDDKRANEKVISFYERHIIHQNIDTNAAKRCQRKI